MNKILVFDWAGEVKPIQWGYAHNEVVEADLHNLIDFFLGKGVKVMVSNAGSDVPYDYLMCVDNRMFTQR
jgi:hypothetical protein